MGSRMRSNAEHVFECFCEVAIPQTDGGQAFVLQKYPESYSSAEVLRSVPQFAYPCAYSVDTVTHFSFVFTSLDSKWTFGFCRLAPKSETCIVMMSHLPWHCTFYRVLNHCAELTNRNAAHLSNFLDALYKSDVPPPGLQLSASYCADNKLYEFSASCPDHQKIPSIPEDRNLTEYFNAIDINNMIVIFANMLNERRIIMTSRKLSRLSACVQAANALIYPMHWQHIFIPVLPNHLVDYLNAPMPFLIGVPSVILDRVKRTELGDIVILDADKNKIESPFDDVHMLPTDILHSLKKSLRNPVLMLGDGVARSFLRALVMLIGGYRDALRFTPGQKITFNYDAFVSTRSPSIQSFLEKMLQLQIFRQFIEGRLEMLNDGEGFSDEFEFELNMYEDKSANRLKTQYREWLGAMRKEGGAILKSVNPAVKSAYRQVKDKGKQAYKDLRSKMQNNPNTQEKLSTVGYIADRPNSVPSSPTLPFKNGRSIKKSMSGTVIAKTERTVTYVREGRQLTGDRVQNVCESNANKLHNGFVVPTKNGITPLASSAGKVAPEASPEVSDVDSDHSHEAFVINRIEIDLMGELKDLFSKRSSTDESFSGKSSNSQSSSSSNTLSNNDSIAAITLIAKPIPPPRSQLTRKQKTFQTPLKDNREAPLIELDSPPDDSDDKNTDIFDPLFEKKKTDSNEDSLIMCRSDWTSSTPSTGGVAYNVNKFNSLVTNNSLSSSAQTATNASNPFASESSAKNSSAKAFNFGGSSGQTVYTAQKTSALSLTNRNQTASDMMINWSLSQFTSPATNVNLSSASLLSAPAVHSTVHSTARSTVPTQTCNTNPFHTATNWQHFD